MSSQFGVKIKSLREEKQLLLRQVAASLNMDTGLLSKIENGSRIFKKELIPSIAFILQADKTELETLWLADQIVSIAYNEDVALNAMMVAEEEIKYLKSKKEK